MRTACYLAATISALTVMANAAQALQTPRPPGDRDARREDRQRELREKRLQTLDMRQVLEQRDQARIDAAIKQIKDDFKQIQIIRNEMVHNLVANKPLDYKLILNEAAEINKRADRLKTFLMPPDAEAKDKDAKDHVEFTNDEMKGALVQLCNRIANFIENPVLKSPGTVDVEQSTRAGGDLLVIIELSGNIKRSAEKLNKISK
jgi:cytochrome c556